METIQNYKCPCCGASLIYDGEKQSLHCESCDCDFSVETMKQLDEANANTNGENKYDWESYEPRGFGSTESEVLSGYSCPSCGAEITGDDTMGATVCPYCGNATIIKKQFEGSFMPDYIIPFKIDKKAAMKKFEEAYSKAPFLPDEFKNKKKIEEMSGIYISFWMFDCDCDATINYHGERISYWSDSEYNYTKTDHFRLIRSGSVGFSNVPVDGSQKADNTYTEAVEPYDYSEAVSFNPAYFSGYLADKYDVSAEESILRANERIKNSTETVFKETTSGYAGVMTEQSNVSFSDGKIRYALLPIWMLNIKYNGQMYKYAINGQTGKTVGSYPVCKSKRNKYFLKVFAITLGVCAAVAAAYFML